MITALEYFKIKNRMAYSCRIDCEDCPLCSKNNGLYVSCKLLEFKHTEKAVKIVEQWGKEHPGKIYLSNFLEKYPNAELREDGIPKDICPSSLGLKDIKDKDVCYFDDCITCWNQIIEE